MRWRLSLSRFQADIAIPLTSTAEDTASAAQRKRNLSVPRPLLPALLPAPHLAKHRGPEFTTSAPWGTYSTGYRYLVNTPFITPF
jgi:hypothetical protein